MTKINEKEFDRLAELSKLEFSESEKQELMADLNKTVAFCETLNEVNTDGVEPLIYMTPNTNVVREDRIEGMISKEEALKNAPAKDSDFFRVTKVIKPKQ
ncbi:MAG: Asp-tRNA(Asn)/Glu-tRNA(Gln) amidotransferase subunit GatC [Bacteroidia bacterium]|nr:Asp-tRNA(Asn)/Glu-tRNA(Gln) amidotransferase subunit GatC [Bacteroidia bacterium]MCO5254109.1 Asp-tRNA(Asn)/Glu-tRNA(Gln) amidotransferase subunit GatC [Bacteroidota bacterium]MCZ2129969.1 Asp-tRNA(Asn)/Glu-tRNA(Gln) amidotransferase subunit GatC [Bacteroidia bacterium]